MVGFLQYSSIVPSFLRFNKQPNFFPFFVAQNLSIVSYKTTLVVIFYVKILSNQQNELTKNITFINFHFTVIFANVIEEFFTIFTGVITNLAKPMNLKLMPFESFWILSREATLFAIIERQHVWTRFVFQLTKKNRETTADFCLFPGDH